MSENDRSADFSHGLLVLIARKRDVAARRHESRLSTRKNSFQLQQISRPWQSTGRIVGYTSFVYDRIVVYATK